MDDVLEVVFVREDSDVVLVDEVLEVVFVREDSDVVWGTWGIVF